MLLGHQSSMSAYSVALSLSVLQLYATLQCHACWYAADNYNYS